MAVRGDVLADRQELRAVISLRDLLIDLLWAKAHVLVVGGWKTRPAWQFLRWARAHQRPIPDHLLELQRGHYRGKS